jgi:hypothetical protein
MPKVISNIDREQFLQERPVLVVQLGDASLDLEAKQFNSTGLGWEYKGNIVMNWDGQPTKVWASVILSIIGTKENV